MEIIRYVWVDIMFWHFGWTSHVSSFYLWKLNWIKIEFFVVALFCAFKFENSWRFWLKNQLSSKLGTFINDVHWSIEYWHLISFLVIVCSFNYLQMHPIIPQSFRSSLPSPSYILDIMTGQSSKFITNHTSTRSSTNKMTARWLD